jgi:hypothetical protein
MRRCIFLLALAGLDMAANSSKTFQGTIVDRGGISTNPATQCPVIKPPRYTLQTETEAWILNDEKAAAKYAGKAVIVHGAVDRGNRLNVVSIKPVQ